MLSKLVHLDQTGGRYIVETHLNNTPGIPISVSFKKALDFLEWSCIQNALKKFNFGDGLRKWIEVFYKAKKAQL